MFKRVNFTHLSLLIFFFTLTALNPSIAQDDDGIPTDPAVISAGEKLFNGNCKTCHQVHKKVIGPALKDVWTRVPQPAVPWITAFVKNSSAVIASGDEYAVNLYEEYNKTQMTSFAFKDDQILSIIAYVKAESANVPEEKVVDNGGNQGGGDQTANAGVDSGYLTAILVILIVVLVLILIVLGIIVNVLTKYLKDKKDLEEDDAEVVNQTFDLGKLAKSNGVIGLVIFLFVAIMMKAGIDGLFTVGVQQNYQPSQPIAFSHKIHAGQYEIDCNYCHTGVRKAKSANIPSANICMNCHTAIKTDSEQIQKIYAAIDYNPETQEYGPNTKPIEWVRIHNLPDLAYFNHSQHVKVGGLECETCHGEIKEMDVVYQYAPLTMGWCINCHRETEVNSKGNAYYDNLVEIHEAKSKDPMTVEDIGGLECSKCHY